MATDKGIKGRTEKNIKVSLFIADGIKYSFNKINLRMY
jgi:hypothetical protein